MERQIVITGSWDKFNMAHLKQTENRLGTQNETNTSKSFINSSLGVAVEIQFKQQMPSHFAKNFIRMNQVLKFLPAAVLLGCLKSKQINKPKNPKQRLDWNFRLVLENSQPTSRAGGEHSNRQALGRRKVFCWKKVGSHGNIVMKIFSVFQQDKNWRNDVLIFKVKSLFGRDQLLFPTLCGWNFLLELP